MFLARDRLTEGLSMTEFSYQSLPANIYPCSTDYEQFSDFDEWEEDLSSMNFSLND